MQKNNNKAVEASATAVNDNPAPVKKNRKGIGEELLAAPLQKNNNKAVEASATAVNDNPVPVKKNRKGIAEKLLAAPYIVWAAIFVVVPLFFILYYALTDESGSFTLENLATLGDSNNIEMIIVSIGIALIATVICLLVGYPLAYLISKMKSGSQTVMMLFLMLPMWMNFVIRTNAMYMLVQTFGLLDSEAGKYVAVILGMVYNFLPYMVLPIYSVISKLDKNLMEAAHDLGCNRIQVLFKVLIPLSMPGIVSGITMVFVPSVSTFYITESLANGTIVTVGNRIEQLFGPQQNYYEGSAFSIVLLVLIIISMAIMNKFTSDDDEGGLMF